MELKNAKCPNCGGQLKLNPALQKGMCIYCGSEIIVSEAIAAAQRISGIQTEDAAKARAYQKLEDGDVDSADKDFKHLIDLNPSDWEGHYGRLICAVYTADYYRRLNSRVMANNMSTYLRSLKDAVDSHGSRALRFADTDDAKNKVQRQMYEINAQIQRAEYAAYYERLSGFKRLGAQKPEPLSNIPLFI